ncbi:hypothetical protein QYM36_014367 [Artemia franciscana]|uniref:Innexin n=2 Tax=Artemia franciscana TaxID=6661 RepID=A0AA88HGI7_ARTSF|nr:hypothetical protein QYM36_014367 [Artemia franciscana]
MISYFNSLKSFIENFVYQVTIDNFIFKLHYKVTASMLALFSIIGTLNQFVGDPIDCLDHPQINSQLLDEYCWIHSTFIDHSKMNGTMGVHFPAPGIVNHRDGEGETFKVTYYPFVCLVHFLMACLLCIPYWIWMLWENGIVKGWVQQLRSPVIAEETKKDEINRLVQAYKKRFKNNNIYAWIYLFCEFLNCLGVILVIYLLDIFLGYKFYNYGFEIWKFSTNKTEVNPMIELFPTVTQCIYRKYGPTGTIEKLSTLCVLPLNIINGRVYAFLWFWLVIVEILSIMSFLYRIATFCFKWVRRCSLRARATFINGEDINWIIKECKVGDWFFLLLLAKNMEHLAFKEFISSFKKALPTDKISSQSHV